MDTNAPHPSHGQLQPHYTVHIGGTFMHVMGNYNHYRAASAKGGFELLQDACAPSAFHNSGEGHVHPLCHPNTRVAILRTIMGGIAGQTVSEDGVTTATPDRFIFLTGPAGAGKSAISSTIAGRCYEEGRLLASFFFRLADPNRNHSRQFFPTIAYQICIAIPQARNHIAAVIEKDPMILKKSLSMQLDSLLINPLLHLMNSGMLAVTGRYCIVIDGLDECVDKEKKARSELLEILVSGITRTSLPLVFFIASRPEYDITSVINTRNVANISSRLYLDDKYLPDADIRLYLHENFKAIKATHPSRRLIPPKWPSDASLDALVDKASGQFIYAATVVKYVSSNQHNAMERLELVLVPHFNHKDTPFAELDALYMHILSEIEDIETLLRILSFYRLQNTFGIDYCGLAIWVLGYTEIMIQRQRANILPMLISNLASLVTVWNVHGDFATGAISFQVHHASFIDFLCDRRRSGRYYMDLGWWREEHISFACQYLRRCKSEGILESSTLLSASRYIKANLDHKSIKTVFSHFSQFSIEDLHRVLFSCHPRGNMIQTFFGILHSLERLPSSPESSTVHSKLSQVFDYEYLNFVKNRRIVYAYRDVGGQFYGTWGVQHSVHVTPSSSLEPSSSGTFPSQT